MNTYCYRTKYYDIPPHKLFVLRPEAHHGLVDKFGVAPNSLTVALGFGTFNDVKESGAHVAGTIQLVRRFIGYE